MCTLHYSVNSHRKIVHLSHCKVLRRIPKESRRSFESLEEAKAHGYRLCRCCPSIAQKYRKERNQVKRFCRDHDFTFMLLNDVIHVISRHDCWRIITCGNNKRLFLIYSKEPDRGGSCLWSYNMADNDSHCFTSGHKELHPCTF